jgi:hemoglobin
VKKQTLLALSAVLLALSLGACSSMSHQEAAPMVAKQASLYDRLGGKGAITAVVDDFVGNVAGDERINGRFGKTDIPKLKRNLVDQVCAATGGPCTYTGKDMKTAHTGMRIQDAEFGALVEDLIKSLNKFKVGKKEQDELLGALGGMKKDIVNQ